MPLVLFVLFFVFLFFLLAVFLVPAKHGCVASVEITVAQSLFKDVAAVSLVQEWALLNA